LVEARRRDRLRRKALQDAKSGPHTDIVYWIARAQTAGDLDEVFWLAFLAGHFGRPTAGSSSRDTTGIFLCAFGTAPRWTWSHISSDPESFRKWLNEEKERLRYLKYSNHRKFESQKPGILSDVMQSFIDWARESGGSPCQAFDVHITGDPHDSFRRLYRELGSKLRRFRRLAAFDTLWFIGELGLLPVKADSCYLSGATGPLRGARKLWGPRPPRELTKLADEAARALKIPYEVFEDALCRWQK
jgi:hypothetical protein